MWTIWEQIKNSLGDLDVFGENLYGLHSIEYSNLESYFYIFAIRDGDKWLSWDEVVFYAQVLDLPTVPVLARGIFTENDVKTIINTALSQGSQLGGACEGVVCRTSEGFETAAFRNVK